MKNIIYLCSLVLLIGQSAHATQKNEFHESCAASPEELYQKPDTLALLERAKTGPTINLNSMKGVWQVQGIPFRKDQIGVNVRTDGFFVQIRDIIKKASICIDEERPGWIRISIHGPRCPENKNIYAKAHAPNLIEIEAYQTRVVGSAKFRRVSNSPTMNVPPQPVRACAKNYSE